MSAGDRPRTTGTVLAGGAATRLGGISKERIVLPGGGTLMDATVASMCRAGAEKVLVSGRGGTGLPSVPDIAPGAGPVAGIASAIVRTGDRGVFLFAPCDTAGLDHRDLSALCRVARPGGGSFLVTRTEGGGMFQPLLLAIHHLAVERILNALSYGHLCAWRLWLDLEFIPVLGCSVLLNVNTPGDLDACGSAMEARSAMDGGMPCFDRSG